MEEGIKRDPDYQNLKEKITQNTSKNTITNYRFNEKGLILVNYRLYVPNILEVKLLVLNEMHKSPYFGHLGYQKMITMLIKRYVWYNMKNEVAEFLARCFECQEVKVEHQHPSGILQSLPIPNWKWEVISVDFLIGLPKTRNIMIQ